MNTSEIRGMRSDELGKKLAEFEKQLFTLRSQAVTEKIENTAAVKNLKKDIARIKTIVREIELGSSKKG